ncbi:hypothetical protein ASE01_06970 [Nocardioides sp. Root190]|nr:hypothetical protein ASE01_06970 [Nocardioides sp. Root190]
MATAVVVPVLAALSASPAGAVSACAVTPTGGQTLFTWTGGGADGKWMTAANWQVAGAPDEDGIPTYYGADATTDDSLTGFICIAPLDNPTITLDSNVHVHMQAIEVSGATLVAGTGSRVMVYAPEGTAVSTIGSTATVKLRGGTLGGPGQIDVSGTVVWGESSSPVGALDNDFCANFPVGEVIDACAGISTSGRLVVTSGGDLDVLGRGTNLFDGYTVQIASGGALDITGKGYVAADRDTTIEIDDNGTLTFASDGNVFEGRANATSTLADFVNNGTVHKDGGAGVSSINASYSGDGAVLVDSGTLNIANGDAARAALAAGASLGTGTCVEDKVGGVCLPSTTATDQQNATVEVDQESATVSVSEELVIDQAGDLQPQVEVDTAHVPTSGQLTLHYDRSVVDLAGSKKVEIFRNDTLVRDCVNGGFPDDVEVVACVLGRSRTDRAARAVILARAAGLEALWRAQARPHFYRATTPLVGGDRNCAVTTRTYPYASLRVWRRSTGPITIRYSSTATGVGTALRSATVPGGPSSVTKVPVRSTGYLHVRDTTTGQTSQYYAAVATGAVDFTRLTRTVPRGKVVTLRGDVDSPGSRSFALYAKSPGSGFLRATGVTGRTTSSGAFSVSYRVPRAATLGTWRFAIRISGSGAMRPGMSDRAVRVKVVRPQPAPPPVVPTVSTDLVSTRNNQPAPVAEGGWTRASAVTCAYYVR